MDDQIEFYDDKGQLLMRQPWPSESHAWPPLEQVGILFGNKGSRPHRLVLGENGEKVVREHVEEQGIPFDSIFHIHWFTRGDYSTLPDDVSDSLTHVVRLAQYRPTPGNACVAEAGAVHG